MIARLFRAHGEFCASHPWEVIVTTLTLTVCMLTVDQRSTSLPIDHNSCGQRKNCLGSEDYNAVDMIVMTAIRCIAVLYGYYQLCNLHKLGSKYILGIAGLFTVFSSLAFSSSVINFMKSDISDLKDALFFFLLLIDLTKATLLAQFALSSCSQEEVKYNIARGMAMLGPTITLDTIVETLVIGVGTLSGIKRLEVLCCFACMSIVVNYIVFMTFYPACLSLILELSRSSQNGRPSWHDRSLILKALCEEDQKPNPVVQRVKVIMSAGLMLVHAQSRWSISAEGDDALSHQPFSKMEIDLTGNKTEDISLQGYLMKWLTVSADQIVILILLLTLAVKFIFFEDNDELLMSDKEKQTSVGNVQNITHSIPVICGPQENYIELTALYENKEVQTDFSLVDEILDETTDVDVSEVKSRSIEECVKIFNSESKASSLRNEEIIQLVNSGHIPSYTLEKALDNPERGVYIRRHILAAAGNFYHAITNVPYQNYDYSKVLGACCENVVGYIPVPVGIAGPLLLDGKQIYVPMATTEGCLVASTNRGCRALIKCGVNSSVLADGMTRGPVVRFPSSTRASDAMKWLQDPKNFQTVKNSFDSTSRYARLIKVHVRIAGRHLFIRFVATTGDAMGMNMLSKGTEVSLKTMQVDFPDMDILSLSGNFCTDKKAAAINWIEGRGKSVVCEAIVPAEIVRSVLKTTVHSLVDVNISKNLIGSAVAGSVGGFNAHAANIVTAIYIATGQDPAQNVASSNCMTLMEPWGEDGEDLLVSCTMPSIEIGTIGGGTVLSPQGACLDMLGVKGANEDCPGQNASRLASIVCATVLAGELSLMSALSAGHLVKSHLRHNRSSATLSSGRFSTH